MLKIRRSWDHLIFNMGIPTLVRWHFYTEMAPWLIWRPHTCIICEVIYNVYIKGIPMLKIRWSRERLIFNMRIPILVRWHLYTEMTPWLIWKPHTCIACEGIYNVYIKVENNLSSDEMSDDMKSKFTWYRKPWLIWRTQTSITCEVIYNVYIKVENNLSRDEMSDDMKSKFTWYWKPP